MLIRQTGCLLAEQLKGSKSKKMENGSKQSNVMKTESNGIYAESQHKRDETSAADDEGVRELSQTDHLNKRLLDSFLQRLNNSQPQASASSASDNTDFEDKDTSRQLD